MMLSFLIPLAIAMIAIYVRYQIQEEIIMLFVSMIALICLIVSFVLAPWMVQILILVSGLLGMRYFCYRHSCQDAAKLH